MLYVYFGFAKYLNFLVVRYHAPPHLHVLCFHSTYLQQIVHNEIEFSDGDITSSGPRTELIPPTNTSTSLLNLPTSYLLATAQLSTQYPLTTKQCGLSSANFAERSCHPVFILSGMVLWGSHFQLCCMGCINMKIGSKVIGWGTS